MAQELLQNPGAWLSALKPAIQEKVAYQALDWVNKASGGGPKPVPGAKKQSTSQKDFLSFMKDGVKLGKLANFLQPGAVEPLNVKPYDEEGQYQNVSKFVHFAKQVAGIGQEGAFRAEDLIGQKKGAFQQVLGTLLQLGLQSGQQFGKSGLDANKLLQLAISSGAAGSIFTRCCSGKASGNRPPPQAAAH